MLENKKELRKLLASWTVSEATYEPTSALFFLDETGNPKFNHRHPVFGVGGCSAAAPAYRQNVCPHWRALKSEVFGLAPCFPFHASEHLRKATPTGLQQIARLFGSGYLRFSAAIMTRDSPRHAMSDAVATTIRHVTSLAAQLWPDWQGGSDWFYEHSDSISRYILVSFLDDGTDAFYLSRSEHSPPYNDTFTFLLSTSCEPGLEIADLMMYLIGARERGSEYYSEHHNAILAAAFDDKTVGLVDLVHDPFPPVWIGADGKLLPPPTLKVAREQNSAAAAGRPRAKT